MGFTRLFSTELSESAATSDFTVNFGDASNTALPGTISTSSLSAEAPQIVKYIRYKLGEPILTAQLANRQIFLAFEEANLKYSSIINTYQARSWMIQYYGLSSDFSAANFTGQLPSPQTLAFSNFLKQVTENVAWEMNPPVGGNSLMSIRKSYIELIPGKQDYDIYDDIIDNVTLSSISASLSAIGAMNKKIDLKTIYHYPSVTLYRFYDPYSSINMLSQEFNFESFNTETIFYVMPIWTDILRAQQLNMNDKVRRSNFSYERVGRRLRIFPTPKINMKLWIDYTPSQQNPFGDESVSGISNFYQIPFTDIAYDKINAPGKYWIRDFTYALCMEIEGRIRRKFEKIPIPGNDIVLDGAVMVTEAIAKQLELEKTLRDDLEKLTVYGVLKENSETQKLLQEQNAMIPTYIYMF